VTPTAVTPTPETTSPAPGYSTLTYVLEPTPGSSVKIEYPQFTGTGLDTVNRIIYDNVRSYATEYVPLRSGDTLRLDYQFTVTLQNSKIISLYIGGTSYLSSAPHPNRNFHTINIDLASMSEVTLTDMYTVDADFEQVFFSKAQQVSGVDGALTRATTYDPFADPERLRCYLTPDGVVISVDVVHAYGDHYEALLRYGDIQQFYKLDQNYWEE